jgi:hypothetical protein
LCGAAATWFRGHSGLPAAAYEAITAAAPATATATAPATATSTAPATAPAPAGFAAIIGCGCRTARRPEPGKAAAAAAHGSAAHWGGWGAAIPPDAAQAAWGPVPDDSDPCGGGGCSGGGGVGGRGSAGGRAAFELPEEWGWPPPAGAAAAADPFRDDWPWPA